MPEHIISLQEAKDSIWDALALYAHLHFHSTSAEQQKQHIESNLSFVFFSPSKYPGSYPCAPAIIPSSKSTNCLSSFGLFHMHSMYSSKTDPFLLYGAMKPPNAPAHVHPCAHYFSLFKLLEEGALDSLSDHLHISLKDQPKAVQKRLNAWLHPDVQLSISVEFDAPQSVSKPHALEPFWNKNAQKMSSQRASLRKGLLPYIARALKQLQSDAPSFYTAPSASTLAQETTAQILEHIQQAIHAYCLHFLVSYHQQYANAASSYHTPLPLDPLQGIFMSFSGATEEGKKVQPNDFPYLRIKLPHTHPLAVLWMARTLAPECRFHPSLSVKLKRQHLLALQDFKRPYVMQTIAQILAQPTSSHLERHQIAHFKAKLLEQDSLLLAKDLEQALPSKEKRTAPSL